jgi:hypothetical protein
VERAFEQGHLCDVLAIEGAAARDEHRARAFDDHKEAVPGVPGPEKNSAGGVRLVGDNLAQRAPHLHCELHISNIMHCPIFGIVLPDDKGEKSDFYGSEGEAAGTVIGYPGVKTKQNKTKKKKQA